MRYSEIRIIKYLYVCDCLRLASEIAPGERVQELQREKFSLVRENVYFSLLVHYVSKIEMVADTGGVQ